MILQSVGRDKTKDISFTTNVDSADEAIEIIERHFKEYESLNAEKEVAKVSIVGAGMQSNAGVAAKMFEALYDEGINIRMISTSLTKPTSSPAGRSLPTPRGKMSFFSSTSATASTPAPIPAR